MKEPSKEKAKNLSKDERDDVLNRIKSREVVREIMDFGVSQSQIVYIIKLLALELEDVQVMNKINAFFEENNDKIEFSSDDKDENPNVKIYT
tara:strand:+ start:207 stop:482 length:276 start_codon:yes stop_codon:yes gene_type:complete